MILEKPAKIEDEPLKLKEIDPPRPGPGQVRVKISCCGACRTDLHIVEGDLPPAKLPLIPGHQIVGQVDELGGNNTKFKKGDRIGVAWLWHTDGICKWCRRGQENLCANSLYTGYNIDGGYAEYALVPEDYAYHIPEKFSDIQAAPLLCAGIIGYRALKRANPREGGKLLLVGFGSSAHIVLQLAKNRGYETYVATRSQKHKRFAEELGADWTGDIREVPDKMDSAISFAPSGQIVPAILEKLDKGGTLSLAGIYMSDIPALNYLDDLYYERDIHPVTANTRQDGLELLQEAEQISIQTRTIPYDLKDANRALKDLKYSSTEGTAVLTLTA